MKVTSFPSDPGPAAWNALLPAAKPREALDDHESADWLIIGAGFAGLSAARRLSELHPGDRIVVLEARQIASGPAGRNSGFMIDLPHVLTAKDYTGDIDKDTADIRLNRAGIDYALDAKEAYGMSDEAISLCGKVNSAVTGRGVEHNKNYAHYLDNLSEPYEILNAQQMQDITGSAVYQNGLFSPGTAMLQPAMYIRALADGICSKQLSIFENSPVISLEKQGTSWIATTKKAKVRASKVFLTVNGHLESFGYAIDKLMHVYTYASMTRALTKSEVQQLGGEPSWALTPADAMGTTVRRISGSGGDRIIVRNTATFDPSLHVAESRITKVAKTHDRSYQYRFPVLKHVPIEYRWGGRLCLSRNNVSVFGQIDDNLFSACCQNGLGTAKGTVSGKLIAELASGEPSLLLADQLAEDYPNKLPPKPIAAIGANAVLRWGEFRAGKEL